MGKNIFEQLPTKGLDRLLHLKTFNNPNLRQFPPPEHFPRIQSLVLSYAYHCCSFLPLQPSDDDPPPSSQTSLHESVIFPANENDFDMTLWNSSMTDIWPQLREYPLVNGRVVLERIRKRDFICSNRNIIITTRMLYNRHFNRRREKRKQYFWHWTNFKDTKADLIAFGYLPGGRISFEIYVRKSSSQGRFYCDY